MEIGFATDVGRKRLLNEDSFFIKDNPEFLCGFVADGMGGHQAGEIASKMASDFIRDYITANIDFSMEYVEASEVLRHAFVEANSSIFSYAAENERLMGMGCTSTLAAVYKEKLITAHVGDSRIYSISGHEINQITKDHTYVYELVMRGEISEERARTHPKRNYITRAMGTEETIKVDMDIRPYNGETILLCSDGLTCMLRDNEIYSVVKNSGNLQQAADLLIEKANDKGGYDNITVVLFDKS